MYRFVLNMWIQGRISADGVQALVGTRLTQAQADTILATPQAIPQAVG